MLSALFIEKEGNVLFNDTINTFYLVIWCWTSYGKTILINTGKRLAARVLLYASLYRHDSTYHDLCYTSRGALAGTRLLKRRHSPIHKELLKELLKKKVLTGQPLAL